MVAWHGTDSAAVLAIAAVSTLPLKAQAQDAAAGEALFGSRCTSCHTADEGGRNGTGPNLFGVVGTVASNRGIEFDYSDVKSGENLATNILLRSGDVVVVP